MKKISLFGQKNMKCPFAAHIYLFPLFGATQIKVDGVEKIGGRDKVEFYMVDKHF